MLSNEQLDAMEVGAPFLVSEYRRLMMWVLAAVVVLKETRSTISKLRAEQEELHAAVYREGLSDGLREAAAFVLSYERTSLPVEDVLARLADTFRRRADDCDLVE